MYIAGNNTTLRSILTHFPLFSRQKVGFFFHENCFVLDPSQQKHTLTSFAVSLPRGTTESYQLQVDPTLGINTEFTLNYETYGLEFEITAPTGETFTQDSDEVITDDTLFTSRLTFMDASGVRNGLRYLQSENIVKTEDLVQQTYVNQI